jgi:hypothetical protein
VILPPIWLECWLLVAGERVIVPNASVLIWASATPNVTSAALTPSIMDGGSKTDSSAQSTPVDDRGIRSDFHGFCLCRLVLKQRQSTTGNVLRKNSIESTFLLSPP